MELLQVEFTPFEEDKLHFSIKVRNLMRGGEGYLSKVPLPFVDFQQTPPKNWRFTLLKVLESNHFNAGEFNEAEQQWLVEQGLLSPEQSSFQHSFALLTPLGRILYQAIFPPGSDTERVLTSALTRVRSDNTHLHIRFAFPANASKYARLPDYPWELLHDGQKFLSQDVATFSRYIEYPDPQAALLPTKTINVLLVSSGAYDSSNQLKKLPKAEREAVTQGLRQVEQKLEAQIRLTVLKSPTLAGLRQFLQENRGEVSPHVLHFDGHGFFGRRCEQCRRAYLAGATTHCEADQTPLSEVQGYLLFEHDDREADYVSAREFGELFRKASLRDEVGQSQGVTVAVLSACKSGMSLGSESVFNGMAQNLIGNGVPSVLAMQYSVRANAATAFVESFYTSLCQKDSLARAVSLGRSAMGAEGNQWYRPVLYLRWRDNEGGQLFTPTKSDVDPPKNSGSSQKIQIERPQGPMVIGQTVNVYQEPTDTIVRKPILMVATLKKNQSQRIIEVKKIKDALSRAQYSKQFDPQNRPEIEASDFSQALSEIRPYIIDIAGDKDGIESLFLEDTSDSAILSNLELLISQLFKLHSKSIECVILNGCYLERQAREIVKHIKFVIGIDQTLEDNKTLIFLNEFYFHLGAGRTIEDSYEAGCYSLQQRNVSNFHFPVILNRQDEIKRRHLEEELNFCERDIQKDPNNAALWRKKADILKDLKRPEEATESYDKAFSIEPDNYEIKTEQGDALEQFGMPEKAVTAYHEALELRPNDYEIWWKQGKALADVEKYNEAIESYKKALADVEKYNEAIESYKKALALKPPSPDNYIVWREYGSILEKLKEYQKTVNSYKESLKLEPRYRASSYEKKRAYKKMYSRRK